MLVRFGALNVVGFAMLGAATANGWVAEIWRGDTSRLTVWIAAAFAFGLALSIGAALRRSGTAELLRTIRYVGNLLVLLGLIGTVLGFIHALSGVDEKSATDVSAIAPMVARLVEGMGIALYTTLVGAVLNVWLMANHRLISAHSGPHAGAAPTVRESEGSDG